MRSRVLLTARVTLTQKLRFNFDKFNFNTTVASAKTLRHQVCSEKYEHFHFLRTFNLVREYRSL